MHTHTHAHTHAHFYTSVVSGFAEMTHFEIKIYFELAVLINTQVMLSLLHYVALQ